jgi:putative NADPH-quinone reductase
MKNIVVILGHPRLESYNNALSQAYERGATEAGAEVRRLDLAKLEFKTSITAAPDYDNKTGEIEPALKEAQNLIHWADHLVFVYPTFWGGMPALLKAFIDRTFLPNFAFRYRKDSPMPEQLLKGKTARIITTMDAPLLWYQLVYRAPGNNALKRAILHFCGVKPVWVTSIGRLRYLTQEQRQQWLSNMSLLAARDAKRLLPNSSAYAMKGQIA